MQDDASTVHRAIFQPHLYVNALRRFADRTVLHLADGTRLTGSEVAEETSRYVQALADSGIRKSFRVGLLSKNKVEVLYVSNAAALAEIVIVALHPMGSPEDYAYIAEDAGLDAVIFDPAFDSRIAELQARCPRLTVFLSLGKSEFGADILSVAAGKSPAPLVAPELSGEEIFRISYSGGTTGKPKAIPTTHKVALAVNTIQMSEWEWPTETRQLLCAPLSHAGGATFLTTLMRGGTLYVLPGFDAQAVLETIEKQKITCLLLVPTMIYALLDHPRIDAYDLSSLEVIYYGASPMSVPRLKEGIRRFGKIFFQFYGQAEAPMSVTVMRRSEHEIDNDLRLASCGKPVPWVDVALLDPAGQEVTDGQPGEICVRGPLVMPGYLNKPELTETAFAHGWLHTGDIAVRDPDGFLRIVDRSKDMIITGGFNVFPREVEDVLASHPTVAQCGVFGIADAYWGEIVAAAVVLRADARVTADELALHVRKAKGVHQAPKRIEFIDELPTTAVGKPDKKALRERFASLPAST